MTVSVIIPTLNAAGSLGRTITSVAGASEIIVVDGGSVDQTSSVASKYGVKVVNSQRGRGIQLAAGAREATSSWLLFLHADTCLEQGWIAEVEAFVSKASNAERVGVFRFSLDDSSRAAKRLEKMVAWRTRTLGLPYGDQGLLISRECYNRVGGFQAITIMEDVDLIRRIGRSRIVQFRTAVRTSAVRWQQEGWALRSFRNITCLALYFLGVPVNLIQRIYR